MSSNRYVRKYNMYNRHGDTKHKRYVKGHDTNSIYRYYKDSYGNDTNNTIKPFNALPIPTSSAQSMNGEEMRDRIQKILANSEQTAESIKRMLSHNKNDSNDKSNDRLEIDSESDEDNDINTNVIDNTTECIIENKTEKTEIISSNDNVSNTEINQTITNSITEDMSSSPVSITTKKDVPTPTEMEDFKNVVKFVKFTKDNINKIIDFASDNERKKLRIVDTTLIERATNEMNGEECDVKIWEECMMNGIQESGSKFHIVDNSLTEAISSTISSYVGSTVGRNANVVFFSYIAFVLKELVFGKYLSSNSLVTANHDDRVAKIIKVVKDIVTNFIESIENTYKSLYPDKTDDLVDIVESLTITLGELEKISES